MYAIFHSAMHPFCMIYTWNRGQEIYDKCRAQIPTNLQSGSARKKKERGKAFEST